MATKSINGEELLNWTRAMDDALINAFMYEYEYGRKVNGAFTTTAYENIIQVLSAQFGRKLDKEKINNRWKTLKRNFSEVYDIFSNRLSGFSWDPSTQLWDDEPQVWEALIQSKPNAAIWRNAPFPNYKKMIILYEADRAAEEESLTAKERQKWRESAPMEEDNETINDPDQLISQKESTLDGVVVFSDGDTSQANLSPLEQPQRVTSSCGKRKRKEHAKDN